MKNIKNQLLINIYKYKKQQISEYFISSVKNLYRHFSPFSFQFSFEFSEDDERDKRINNQRY